MHDETRHREEMLRAYLEYADESCPSCGYSLRGLKGTECPECGERLRLRVGSETPAAGWYASGLIGISAALGFHLTALLVLLPFDWATVQVFLPGTALSMLALIGWIRGRRRVARASTLTRSVLMSCAMVLPVFLLILGAIAAAILGW